ncbi:hypothetical protein RRG08_031246 [Elysia crispata]|uniref:Uncharacterized protein n=1 Tax=Elysia crispata TaxID=231223 RepID=A0AAE1AJG1_9GAST|nr:hypothetical protein RRG08_031246 [Elysia crispata]
MVHGRPSLHVIDIGKPLSLATGRISALVGGAFKKCPGTLSPCYSISSREASSQVPQLHNLTTQHSMVLNRENGVEE